MKKLHLIAAIAAFSLVVLSHNSWAQVSWRKYSYFQNSGGINDNSSSTEIADKEATDMQNMTFDIGGAISKRYGFQNITYPSPNYKLSSGSSAVTGLAYFKTSTGSVYLFAGSNASSSAKFFQKTIDASGNIPTGSWTDLTGSTTFTGYSDNGLLTLTPAQDRLVITANSSNVTYPLAWVPGAQVGLLTSDPDCPKAKYNIWHRNMLFVAGDPSNPSRVSFSDITNGITNWVATDFFDLDKNDGQQIRGMISAFGNLYIFEDHSIWMLSGTSRDDFYLQKMVSNVGAISNQSITLIGNSIVFVSDQNDIAVYDGNFNVKFISRNIRNTIGLNNFNRAQYALGIGYSTYRHKDLDFYVAESTIGSNTNNQILLYDTEKQAWTRLSGFAPNAWAIVPNSSGKDLLVWGDYNGLVYYYPDTNFYNDVSNSCSGANSCTVTSPSIYAYYQTKWFRYSEASLNEKYFRLINTYLSNTTTSSFLTTEIKSDFATSGNIYTFSYAPSGSLWGVAVWGVGKWVGGGLTIDREEPNLGTKMFQIKYSNSESGQPLTILGFDVYIEPSNRV